jgi:DNA-binding NarL/FixJ family response regulator
VEIARTQQPDVALLDLSMPGMDGVRAIEELLRVSPHTRVLVLSMHRTAEYVRPALLAGATGFVVKGKGIDRLVTALRTVVAGERYLDADVEPLDAPRAAAEVDVLTVRERQILVLVAEGHTNRSMAEALGLSVKTVDAHRSNLMRKLGLHDAQALTRFAIRTGLISP